jgi:hypothetical protein
MRDARTILFWLLFLAAFAIPSFGQELKEYDADYLNLSARNPDLEPAVDAIVRSTN